MLIMGGQARQEADAKKHPAPGASSSNKVCRAPVAFSWYLTGLAGKETGKKFIGFQTRLRQLHQGGARWEELSEGEEDKGQEQRCRWNDTLS